MTLIISRNGPLFLGLLALLLISQPVRAQHALIFSKPGPLDYSAQISEDILTDIPQIATWFAEIIPPCHRRGNGTISAATR